MKTSEKIYKNFIGPNGENIDQLKKLLESVLDNHRQWRKSYYKKDRRLYDQQNTSNKLLEKELNNFLKRSNQNIPYFHPRYSAQMLKDPSIPTILGCITFMLSNPNNHAYEGGPVTTEMEMEVTDLMLKMCGYKSGWGHLTSGGSLANMEALWAARDFYGNGTVYFSEVSHYSWKRICKILQIKNFKEIIADENFRMDLNHLEHQLKKNKAMCVIANLGSTGTGSVDDIKSIIALREKYGFHLHIDAAYGGFVRSVLLDDDYKLLPFNEEIILKRFVYDQLKAIKDSDSVTVDPHKHGLISYGAGAVLFKNKRLREIILNTAPYTYHIQDKPNIGMFSLEGSRPGAMAAACYLTYKVLPPNQSGTGEVIKLALSASKKFYELIENSNSFRNLNEPDLDINCFYRIHDSSEVSNHNKQMIKVYEHFSIENDNPEFILSKFVMPSNLTKRVLPELKNKKKENFISLRSVFMKHWGALENFYYVRKLVEALENFQIS